MNVLRAEHLLGGRFGELFAVDGWVRSLFLDHVTVTAPYAMIVYLESRFHDIR